MKVLLLGAAGATGRRAAAELARSREVDGVICADANKEALADLVAIFGGRSDRISSRHLDARDEDAVADAAGGVEVVASAAGPSYLLEAPALRATIAARKPYVSLSDDPTALDTVRSLDESARARNVTAISGVGFSPGITNLLAAMAAASDDSVKEIAISVATSWAELEGPSRAINILMSLSKSSFEPHGMPSLLYFPEPVGWVETFSAAHPELESLPHKFKDLEELRYRVGLVEPAAMDLMRASVALGAAANDTTRRRWARLIGPVGKLIGGLPPRRGAWTAARVDVWGDRSGHTATTSLGVVDHFYNLASVPLALCAIELGTKRLQRAGVHAPEDALDPRRFLGLLSHRGVRIARLEPNTV